MEPIIYDGGYQLYGLICPKPRPLDSRGTPRLPDSDMLFQTESLSFPFASETVAQKTSPLPLILLWRTSRAATRKPCPGKETGSKNLRENPPCVRNIAAD